MKKTGRILKLVLLFFAAAVLLSGCGEDRRKYDQAGKDLEQGSYSYALDGYMRALEEGGMEAKSLRGAGIALMRLGRYAESADYFTRALGEKKVSKPLRKDILSYRAETYYLDGQLSPAMADCQTLSEEYGKDADTAFLTALVALAMDAYQEAEQEFGLSYEKDPSYERAFEIYQAYLDRGMEASGTVYLEKVLAAAPSTAEDYCDRGRVFYYMEDYQRAAEELRTAVNQNYTDAFLLLGMVYMAQNDTANARAMFRQYIERSGDAAKGYNGLALCDLQEENYRSALSNIASGIPYANTEEMQTLLFNEIVVYEREMDYVTAEQKAWEYVAMFPEDKAAAKELTFLRSRNGHL